MALFNTKWITNKRSWVALHFLFAFFLLIPSLVEAIPGHVLLSEIHYNPPDHHLESGDQREFIEIYNPTNARIDISGYAVNNGFYFTFPARTFMEPQEYIVIARNPDHPTWNSKPYRIFGPCVGRLSDSGERVTLAHADGTDIDTVRYRDTPPWPRAADGYGSSLERIDWDVPAADPHCWRASARQEGTPGTQNSVFHKQPYPLLINSTCAPPHPTSSDTVQIQACFDTPDRISSATLRYEIVSEPSANKNIINERSSWRYWKGHTAPSAGLEWTEASFNDGNWFAGQNGFGYGDLDQVNTVLSDMRNNYSTLYLRRTFVLDSSDTNARLLLRIYYDDGFICYINGKEVARANAPQPYTHQSTATNSHEANALSEFELDTAGLLTPGMNVLALVGFNISLGGSSDFVLAASLDSQNLAASTGRIPMIIANQTINQVTFHAPIPPGPSQSLVRANIEITRVDGSTELFPCENEPHPFISYFVYDNEMKSPLPILWMLPPQASTLLNNSRKISGVVCLPAGQQTPDVFDGAIFIPSASNRVKFRFIKGAEFYGDRTINIIPEIPTGGTNSGVDSPYREHLGFWFYREMGVPSPWANFYRVIPLPYAPQNPHTQHLIIQQVNERFLELNGRNADADLYKLVYSNPNWEKHTNKDDDTNSIQELLSVLHTSDTAKRRQAMEQRLVLDEFLAYSAASIFTSNWDGYWNNNWMVLDPDTAQWEIIPWDLDWVWGATPPPNTGPMYARMPLSFPIDGVAIGDTRVSRKPGPVTAPMHKDAQFYEDYIQRISHEFNRTFARENLFTQMDATQNQLLEDLEFIHQQTGRNIDTRVRQITESYETLKIYVQARRAFLEGLLPVSIEEWSLYESNHRP
jgi:hypothetical protein